MPDILVRSFASFLLAFQPCFTQPSFASFRALTCAWILCSGRHSLTRVIQSGQLGRFKHYCSFHRFFSQSRWNLDDLGYCIFQLLLPFCPEILIGAVDDTLARKSGRHIWGAGMHHDPLRSTQKRPFFSFGHSWVVFSLHLCLRSRQGLGAAHTGALVPQTEEIETGARPHWKAGEETNRSGNRQTISNPP